MSDMFLASVFANTLLQFIIAVSSFLIMDLPGEKPARYAFRTAYIAYFLGMLIIFLRLVFFPEPSFGQSVAFVLTSWAVGVFMVALALGFGWRSGSSNIFRIAVVAVVCYMVATFFGIEDMQRRTRLYSLSAFVAMSYVIFATLTRKPRANIADKMVAFIAALTIAGILFRQYQITGVVEEDFSQARYVWIILSPTLVAGISIFALGSYMSDAVTALTRQAIRDPLTNLFNRRHLVERTAEMLAYADRRSLPVSLILLDIDNFKTVNDTWGHDAGDTALKDIARILLDGSRAEDLVVRLGGEEFVVLMQSASMASALAMAERLREAIEKSESVAAGNSFKFTASFGVINNEEGGDGLDEMLSKADSLLYQAKEKGRNRVVG